MARIAYVDHSYHRQTRATVFLPEMLRAYGHEVDVFWDDAWTGGDPVRWKSVATHDVVVMFQSYCPSDGRTFRTLHPNVVYVPMFDQFGFSHGRVGDLSAFWKLFRGSKVLSFSTAVHVLATSCGIASHLVHFYPEVPETPPRVHEGLHGFFWLRREVELGWHVVRALVGATRFDSFHLHLAGDPGFPPVQLPGPEDLKPYNVSVSTWFDDWSDLDEVARRANVYFAPRLEEGIGQAFLEAMGRGQCVVASDRPTMNEYIVHGLNGLLYDPRSPKPLDFSEAARLGESAWRGASAGRQRWRESEQPLVDFILTPSSAVYAEHVAAQPASRVLPSVRSAARRVWSRWPTDQ